MRREDVLLLVVGVVRLSSRFIIARVRKHVDAFVHHVPKKHHTRHKLGAYIPTLFRLVHVPFWTLALVVVSENQSAKVEEPELNP